MNIVFVVHTWRCSGVWRNAFIEPYGIHRNSRFQQIEGFPESLKESFSPGETIRYLEGEDVHCIEFVLERTKKRLPSGGTRELFLIQLNSLVFSPLHSGKCTSKYLRLCSLRKILVPRFRFTQKYILVYVPFKKDSRLCLLWEISLFTLILKNILR